MHRTVTEQKDSGSSVWRLKAKSSRVYAHTPGLNQGTPQGVMDFSDGCTRLQRSDMPVKMAAEQEYN